MKKPTVIPLRSLRRTERFEGYGSGHHPYMVHQLHRRLEAVFSLPSEPLDAIHLHWQSVAEAERVRHAAVLSNLRKDICNGQGLASAAQALTTEADHCVRTMLAIAQNELAHDCGPAPGRFAVLALGKLGGGELTLTSDLDLLFVYEPASAADDVAAADYFPKLGQQLVKLLSWTPNWNETYEVDLRLRPHGQKGAIAIPLSGLVHYVNAECWTWELQALTRLRAVGGDSDLGDAIMAAARDAIRERIDPSTVACEVAEMRALMDRDRPAKSIWDVKLSAGGLVDIEFIVQSLQLAIARKTGCAEANTGIALVKLSDLKVLNRRDSSVLRTAWALYSNIRQVQSALDGADLNNLSGDQAGVLIEALGYPSTAALHNHLTVTLSQVRRLFTSLLKVETDESVTSKTGTHG